MNIFLFVMAPFYMEEELAYLQHTNKTEEEFINDQQEIVNKHIDEHINKLTAKFPIAYNYIDSFSLKPLIYDKLVADYGYVEYEFIHDKLIPEMEFSINTTNKIKEFNDKIDLMS